MNVHDFAPSSYPALVPTSAGTQMQTLRRTFPACPTPATDGVIDVIEIRTKAFGPVAGRVVRYPACPSTVEKGTLIDLWI